MRGCHARYQDFMVFGNQLKPAYYGFYYLHHLKRYSYCSLFNEVKQWSMSGILNGWGQEDIVSGILIG